MEHITGSRGSIVAPAIDLEFRLVRDAIEMVARGGSPRVVVAGIAFGELLIAEGSALAASAGVRLVPLWMADDAGADIAVEMLAR